MNIQQADEIVARLYQELLGRPAVADKAGRWGKIQSLLGGMSEEDIRKSIMQSKEYKDHTGGIVEKSEPQTHQPFVIGNKTYNISHNPNDNYFNNLISRTARSNELGRLSQIFKQYLPKKTEGMIDVGANIGVVTLLMEQYVNSSKILSIEPNQTAYQFLERNCASNHLTPIMMNCAAGENRGNLHFCSTAGSSSWSHIVTEDHINPILSYDIKVEQLDYLVAESGLKQVDFIKIDTEGHEWQVLKGATNIIKTYNPWIFMEFNSWTLIAFSNINPRGFMEYLMNTYEQVGQVRQGQDILWIKSQQDMMAFLHDNLVNHGCVDDLLIRRNNV